MIDDSPYGRLLETSWRRKLTTSEEAQLRGERLEKAMAEQQQTEKERRAAVAGDHGIKERFEFRFAQIEFHFAARAGRCKRDGNASLTQFSQQVERT